MSDGTNGGTDQNGDVTELKATIARLEAEKLTIVTERDNAKNKLRDAEGIGKTQPDPKLLENTLKEVADWKGKYETLQSEYGNFKSQITQEEVKRTVSTALEAAGAKAVSTALKAVDLTAVKLDEQGKIIASSVEELIKQVKETDPILFGDPKDPKAQTATTTTGGSSSLTLPVVKRAGEGAGASTIEQRLKEARDKGDMKLVQQIYKEAMQPVTH